MLVPIAILMQRFLLVGRLLLDSDEWNPFAQCLVLYYLLDPSHWHVNHPLNNLINNLTDSNRGRFCHVIIYRRELHDICTDQCHVCLGKFVHDLQQFPRRPPTWLNSSSCRSECLSPPELAPPLY